MKKLTFIALLLGSVGLTSACSGNEVETTSTTVKTTRTDEESVSRSGTCDPSDIDIDHVEVHATGRTGQPGSCQLPVG